MEPLTAANIYQITRAYFSELLPDSSLFKFLVIVADNSYFTAPEAQDIQQIIKSDPILLPQKYRRDIFDCDDYAIYLKSKMNLIAANTSGQTRPFAFGYLLTTNHAFNLGIANNKRPYIINTQSDEHDFIYPSEPMDITRFLMLNSQNLIKQIYI